MFGVDTSEFLVVAVIALLFIGPKDLPRVMMQIGRWIGKARGYARHFTSGVENVIREAELDEMEKKWREENQKILSQYPADGHYPEPVPADTENYVMTALAPTGGDQPQLPLDTPPIEVAPVEVPGAPDDDPLPPAKRPLP